MSILSKWLAAVSSLPFSIEAKSSSERESFTGDACDSHTTCTTVLLLASDRVGEARRAPLLAAAAWSHCRARRQRRLRWMRNGAPRGARWRYGIPVDHREKAASSLGGSNNIQAGKSTMVLDCCKLMAFFKRGLAKLVTQAMSNRRSPFITFVLGGPGSGKGTQCTKIAETFKFEHLSAGDLLRKEISSNTLNGEIIRDIIKEGKIVPSEITVNLLSKAIQSSGKSKVLIDGFPRSEENRLAFEKIVGVEPDLVLVFDCPEEEMVGRVLNRNQGRIDDNIDTIKKRFEVFKELSLPVIDHYTAKGKVYKVNAVGTVDEVFEKIRPVFVSMSEHEKTNALN